MGMVHKGGNAVPFHGDHHPVKVSTHRKSRNLFNQSHFNTEVNGITFSTDEDGTITVNGKPRSTGTFYYYSDYPAGTYTISVRFLKPLGSESNKHIGVRVRNKKNKQYVQLVDTGIDYASAQVENEAHQQLKIGILVSKDITYDNYKLQIQFEEGSEATSFEPYGLIEQPIFEPIDQAQDGKTLTFENTYNDVAEVTVFGESTQDGEPTPEAPVPIESIKSVELVSSNADGSKSATRTIDLQGHELRSLPDGTHDELLVHRDGTVELVQRCDASMFEPSYPVSSEWKLATPKTIQLPSIDPLPTYHPYTFVDGNGADISARVRVFE